jgi:hypothetical protein
MTDLRERALAALDQRQQADRDTPIAALQQVYETALAELMESGVELEDAKTQAASVAFEAWREAQREARLAAKHRPIAKPRPAPPASPGSNYNNDVIGALLAGLAMSRRRP